MIVYFAFSPGCPFCKPLARDLLLLYNGDPNIVFSFHSVEQYRWDTPAENYFRQMDLRCSYQPASLRHTDHVPTIFVKNKYYQIRSGMFASKSPFNFHPVSLYPVVREIKPVEPDPFSPLSSEFNNRIVQFYQTVLGKKLGTKV